MGIMGKEVKLNFEMPVTSTRHLNKQVLKDNSKLEISIWIERGADIIQEDAEDRPRWQIADILKSLQCLTSLKKEDTGNPEGHP
jgi:hypothetical protein